MDKSDYQGNTRFGATFGYAVTRRQAIRVSFFDGAVTRIGADIRSIGIAYNFIWKRGLM